MTDDRPWPSLALIVAEAQDDELVTALNLEEYTVTWVTGAHEAVTYLENVRPDVVVVAISIHDGLDTLLPVAQEAAKEIIVTADAHPDTRRLASHLGLRLQL